MKYVKEDIKNNSFRPVYLFYGDESYLLLQYRNELLDALVTPDNQMNYLRLGGSDISIPALIDFCETIPFFSDKRVVFLEDTGFFKNKCDALADYLKELPPHAVLVFSEKEVDKRGRMYKTVKDKGRIVECTRPDDASLMKWIETFLNKNGRRVDRQTADYLLSLSGSSMEKLRNEMEKLISYTAGRNTVSVQDIDAVCSKDIKDRIFEMIRAVTLHDQNKALELYQDLLALKVKPFRILFFLGKQFSQMLQVKEMEAQGKGRQQIASEMGLRPFVIRNLSDAARFYTASSLRAAIEDCVTADEDVKTGKVPENLSVELLIIKYSMHKA